MAKITKIEEGEKETIITVETNKGAVREIKIISSIKIRVLRNPLSDDILYVRPME